MRKKVRLVPATTNNLTTAIIMHFRNDGHFACRINNGAIYDPVKKVFRKRSEDDPTIGDVHATLNPSGLSCWIEVKNAHTGDKPSKKQRDFAKQITKRGGLHHFAKTWEGFKLWYSDNVVSERDLARTYRDLPGINCLR